MHAGETTTRNEPTALAARWLASSFGLGYLPIAPGTWGSLGGVILYLGLSWAGAASLVPLLVVNAVVAAVGVWAADGLARQLQRKDPGPVVIDEVSGQLITFLVLPHAAWHYLLAGFLLFRLFDIWKPFPARQAEALPGGLGIMADDWIAGLYAALVLAGARYFGL